jgi:hypothetical protein
VKKTTRQEDKKTTRQQDNKMRNSLAHQAKIVTWPPFFYVHQPIKRRLRRKKHRQLEENINKNDGCGNKFNASGFFKTEKAFINKNFKPDSLVF